MTKRSLILIGIVAAGLPMLAQDTIRSGESGGWGPAAVAGDNLFDGYFRTGVGTSSTGGDMVSFDLGRNGHYRLGNEPDTYGEIGWNKKVYDKDGCAFFVHAMLNWYTPYTTSLTSNTQVGMEQAWTEAKGALGNSDAFKDATVWMGERFYNRQDVHMLDWKYLHTDGQGGGIENINLGFGKLAYAYMVSDGAAKGNITEAATNGGARDSMALHQLKLDDIDVNPGGKLYFALEFDSAQPYTGPSSQVPVAGSYNNYVSNSSNNKGGASIIVMHTQSVLNGANHLVFQYATGAAEGLGNGDQFGRSLGSLGSGNKATRVIDEISGQPTKNFGFEAVAAYESDKLDSGTGMTANGSWATVGFRPKIGITDHFSIEGEFGWEKTTLDTNAYTQSLYTTLVLGGGVAPLGNRTLTKETIALEWSPTTEFWSRPSMRLFYTNASWNKQAQGSVGGGASSQSSAFVFADKTSGSQYGVQTEVWF